MAMVIFTALCVAGAVFLLYVLYHFRREDLLLRDAALRASRSVVVQEIEPKVSVADRASNLKLPANRKLLVIQLEAPEGTDTIGPFAGLSSRNLVNPQEDGFPKNKETHTEEEG